MSNEAVDRRGFLKTTGSGVAAAGALLAMGQRPARGPRTEKEKLARLASNTWPLRYIFKTRSGAGRGSRGEMMKAKYGEITMLDMPQFTKDTFPGVTHMDIFSGLFGDVTDDSMFAGRTFDPMSASGRKWLELHVPGRRDTARRNRTQPQHTHHPRQPRHDTLSCPICELPN